MKKILILNGTISEIPIIHKARELGFYVVTTGNMPDLPGHRESDEYICEDYSNSPAILELVKKNGIEGIVSCANDFGVITASYVADAMHWPGHDTYRNACILHQKDRCKELLHRLGIRSPRSTAFTSRHDAVSFAQTAEYPIMVKATDLTGGKGIQRADNPQEAEIAIDQAFERSRKKSIVIEPFISGTQQSLDAFVINGRVAASVSNDVFCPINPYLIQSEILPAEGIGKIEGELHSFIETICAELQLVDGMFTLQYIVKDGKPYVIELMRRCLGNQFLTVAHAVSGFPFEEALVRAETGMDLSGLRWEAPLAPATGHHGIMVERNGVFQSYSIDAELKPYIFKTIDLLRPGARIRDYMNERIGYLYFLFPDRETAMKLAGRFNELVRVQLRAE